MTRYKFSNYPTDLGEDPKTALAVIVLVLAVAFPCWAEEGIQHSKIKKFSIWSASGGEKYPEPSNPNQNLDQIKDEIKFVTFHETETVAEGGEKSEISTLNRSVVQKNFGGVAYHFLVGNSGVIYQGRPLGKAPASGTFYYPVTSLDRASNKYHTKKKASESDDLYMGGIDNNSSYGGKTSLWTYFRDQQKARKPHYLPGDSKGHITISFLCDSQHPETPTEPSGPAKKAAARLAAEILLDYGLELETSLRAHREVCNGTSCPGEAVYSWLRGDSDSPNPDHKGIAYEMIQEAMKEISE